MLSFFTLEEWQILVGGISTLAIYSFLYRENPFYRFFEHLYIGIATAIGVMATVRNFFWPQILEPLFGKDRIPFPDGTYAEPYHQEYMLLLIPMVFGLLYYFILTKRYSWLAQVVIGFSLGVGGGMAFKGVLTEIIPLLTDSFRPLYLPPETVPGITSISIFGASLDIQNWMVASLSNIIFVFTLLTVLSYFFFTFKRTPGGAMEKSASLGRWMMMGCFGAFFGATIQARTALLVERLQFLIDDWWPLFFG